MKYVTPQQELIDNLYELQSARERIGVDPELSVMNKEIQPDCSFFIDYKTCTHEFSDFGDEKVILDGTKLVLTALPKDEREFSGALLCISNSEGIGLPNGVASTDTLFFIGKTLTVQCMDESQGVDKSEQRELLNFDTQKLADMIKVPQAILPLPQSEEDPRQIPEDLDSLYWPRDASFPLGAGMFERELVQNTRLIADKVGIIQEGDTEYGPMFYRVQISENMEDFSDRYSEFDRSIKIAIKFSDVLPLEIIAPGTEEVRYLNQSSFSVKVVRQGMVIYGLDYNGSKRFYVPTEKTKSLIDRVVLNADNFDTK